MEEPAIPPVPTAQHDPELTMDDWRDHLLMTWFRQMMFVSGETGEPSPETTGIIEEIVRQQVVEIVSSRIGPVF